MTHDTRLYIFVSFCVLKAENKLGHNDTIKCHVEDVTGGLACNRIGPILSLLKSCGAVKKLFEEVSCFSRFQSNVTTACHGNKCPKAALT